LPFLIAKQQLEFRRSAFEPVLSSDFTYEEVRNLAPFSSSSQNIEFVNAAAVDDAALRRQELSIRQASFTR
jgi:hypothetical protein